MTSAGATQPVGRSARLTLLGAGAFAQIAAIRPNDVLTALALAVALLALTAAAAVAIQRPVPVSAAGNSTSAPRTWLAGTILLAFAIFAATHLHPGDTESLGRSVTVVLVATQIGQAIVLRTIRDAAFGCALVGVLLLAAGMFATNASVGFAIVPAMALLAATALQLQHEHAISGVAVASLGLDRSAWRLAGPVAAVATTAGIALLVITSSVDLGSAAHFRQAQGRGGSGGGNTAATTAAGGAVDLRTRASLSNAPVLSTSLSAPPYLQGAIYDQFDGTSWTATTAASKDATGLAAPAVRTDVVSVLGSGSLTTIYAPGRVAAVTGTHESPKPLRYTVRTTAPFATPSAPPTDTAGTDLTDTQWTQLPNDLPARDVALARSLTAQAATRDAKVAAIETYLRDHEQYQLDSPEPAAGEDAVDDFLFVSHRGFCEQFATADIVLLRALGIPARLVTGYAFGDIQSTPGTRVMRVKDAHAWTQVWYPGTGWISSDPTAGAALAAANATTHHNPFARLLTALTHMRGGRITVAAALGVLAIVVLALRLGGIRIRRRLARRRIEAPPPPPGVPALAALFALNAELARTGEQRRADESLREFGARIGDDALTDALEVVEAECYDAAYQDPATVERAVAAIDRRRESEISVR